MHTVVLGAGPTGCGAALHLAKSGHDVVLVDRDDYSSGVGSADELFASWDRPAVGQFRQPHNFLGRGRAILRAGFPEVYAALIAAGAVRSGKTHSSASHRGSRATRNWPRLHAA